MLCETSSRCTRRAWPSLTPPRLRPPFRAMRRPAPERARPRLLGAGLAWGRPTVACWGCVGPAPCARGGALWGARRGMGRGRVSPIGAVMEVSRPPIVLPRAPVVGGWAGAAPMAIGDRTAVCQRPTAAAARWRFPRLPTPIH